MYQWIVFATNFQPKEVLKMTVRRWLVKCGASLAVVTVCMQMMSADIIVTRGGARWEGQVTKEGNEYLLRTPQGAVMRFPEDVVQDVIPTDVSGGPDSPKKSAEKQQPAPEPGRLHVSCMSVTIDEPKTLEGLYNALRKSVEFFGLGSQQTELQEQKSLAAWTRWVTGSGMTGEGFECSVLLRQAHKKPRPPQPDELYFLGDSVANEKIQVSGRLEGGPLFDRDEEERTLTSLSPGNHFRFWGIFTHATVDTTLGRGLPMTLHFDQCVLGGVAAIAGKFATLGRELEEIHSRSRLGLARAFIRSGHLQKAAEVLESIIKDYPNTPAAVTAQHELKEPQMQEAMIPNYEVVAKEEDRAPIKKQVTLKVVVKGEASESALRTLIQKLYSESLTEYKNKYQQEPDRVYIYIYPSKESAEAGTGAWVIMLEKGPEDAEPKIQINGERLQQMGQPAASRFGLSEEERKPKRAARHGPQGPQGKGAGDAE